MALESGTYISDLNPSNPVGATDKVSTLDDHVRLIKSTLQNTFPNIDGAVTATEDELNHLDGVTGTTGTGKLVLDDAPTIADLTVSGTEFEVNATTLDFNGNTDISGTLAVGGAATFSNNVTVGGAATFSNNVTVGGTATFKSAEYRRPATSFNNQPTEPQEFLSFVWEEGNQNLGEGEGIRLAMKANMVAGPAPGADFEFGNIQFRKGGDSDSWMYMIYAVQLTPDSNGTPPRDVLTIDGFTGEISGNGAGLTNLNASNLSSGTVPSARLPATIGGNKTFSDNVAVGGTLAVDGAVRAGTAATSTSSTLAAGQIHHRSSNTTVPSMNAGQWVAVQNTSTSSITLSQGSGVTLELGGTTTTGNRTLLPKGFAFIYFRANGVGVVHGTGVT